MEPFGVVPAAAEAEAAGLAEAAADAADLADAALLAGTALLATGLATLGLAAGAELVETEAVPPQAASTTPRLRVKATRRMPR